MRDLDQMKRGVVIEGRDGQVRVLFDDHDETPSPWLDVAHMAAHGARVYLRPKPGAQVVCLMDRNWETGVVVGSIYSDEDPAPADSDKILHIELGDGTTLTHGEEDGRTHLDHVSGFELTIMDGGLTVKGDVIIDANLTVTGETDLKNTKINGVTQIGS